LSYPRLSAFICGYVAFFIRIAMPVPPEWREFETGLDYRSI
jgi:hypothetical protein